MLSHPTLMENIARRAKSDTPTALKCAAQGAVLHADALLAELAKENNDE